MKTKYILALVLGMPVIFFSYWINSINVSLKHENTVNVRMDGFDPRDILSGHYLYLRPNWQKTDCSQFKSKVCPTELFSYSYRYYLPEFDARDLELKIAGNQNLKIEMVFVINGSAKPLVKELLINGKGWQEWLLSQS